MPYFEYTGERSMIASGYNLPPYMFLKADSQNNVTHHFGIVVEMLNWLAAYTRTSLSFVDVEEQQKLKYGNAEIIINLLLKNEIDIGSFLFLPIWEKTRILDYTYPVGIENLALMVPYPKAEQDSYQFTALLRPFNATVWLVLAITFVCLTAFISVYHRYHDRNLFEFELIDIIHRRSLYVLSILSGRSANGNYFILPYKSFLSVRLTVGIWVLMTVALFSFYTSCLTSFLAVDKLKPIVNSFKELASSKEYHLVQPAHAETLDYFLNATKEPYKTLGDSLRRNPRLVIKDYPERLAERLIEYNGVFAQTSVEIQVRIGIDMKKNRKNGCRFTASKKLTNSVAYYMALRKGYLYGPNVNQGIIRLWETGLIRHWLSAYMPNIDKCLVFKHQSLRDEVRAVKALSVFHLSGAFLFLLIGVLMALAAFFVEKILF